MHVICVDVEACGWIGWIDSLDALDYECPYCWGLVLPFESKPEFDEQVQIRESEDEVLPWDTK